MKNFPCTLQAGAGDATLDDVSASDEDALPAPNVQASKPKDFIIFINLVDFTKDLLQTKQQRRFDRFIAQP